MLTIAAQRYLRSHTCKFFPNSSLASAQNADPFITRFEPLMSLRYPPISSFAKKVLSFLMFAGINFSRPKSIEHEEELLRRKTWRWRLIVFGFLMGALAGGKMLLGKGQ